MSQGSERAKGRSDSKPKRGVAMKIQQGFLNKTLVTYVRLPVSKRSKDRENDITRTFRQALGEIIRVHLGSSIEPPGFFRGWITEKLEPVFTKFYEDVLESGRFLDWFQLQVMLNPGGVVVLIGAIPTLNQKGRLSEDREMVIGFLSVGKIRSLDQIRGERLLWQPYSLPSFCLDNTQIEGLIQATDRHVQSVLLTALSNGGSLIVKLMDGQGPPQSGSGYARDLERNVFYVDNFSVILLEEGTPTEVIIARSKPLGQIQKVYARAFNIRSYYEVGGFVGLREIEELLLT